MQRERYSSAWLITLGLATSACGENGGPGGSDGGHLDSGPGAPDARADADASTDAGNLRDATEVVDVGPFVPKLSGHWVHNSFGQAGDSFGSSVLVDGERAFVGASGVEGFGATYVFEKIEDYWVPVSMLAPLLQRAGERFGASLTVSGSTLAVGAPGRSVGFVEAGEVVVFVETSPGSWVERATIGRDPGTPSNAVGARGHFGESTAFTHDWLFVSAPGEGRSVSSGGVNPEVGAIYHFARTASTSDGVLRAGGTAPDDFFSTGMSTDGSHLVASCVGVRCAEGFFVADLAADLSFVRVESGGVRLGPHVAVANGATAITSDGGDVRLYHLGTNGGWTEGALIFGSPAEREVLALKMVDGHLLVLTGRTNTSLRIGELWLFEVAEGEVTQLSRIEVSDDWERDGLGALDFDGTWGAIGAPRSSDGAGAVFFFTVVSESCAPRACPDRSCGRLAASDGCGGVLDCGGCLAPQTCGGAGLPNVCGCAERRVTEARSPGAATGSSIWTNPDRIFESDDLHAEARTLASGESSGPLIASDFGFSIPAEAVIEGIELHVERAGDSSFVDESVQLLRAGEPGMGQRKRFGRWEDAPADTDVIYGHAADTWDETWTAEDVNRADFGVSFSASYEDVAGNGIVRIDHVNVRVYYGVSCQ